MVSHYIGCLEKEIRRISCKCVCLMPSYKCFETRHKTIVNYGNLLFDKVEKRVAKILLCDLCWSSSWVKKVF